MKTFTLATLSGLVTVVLAAAVPEVEVAALDKKADSTIYITLCNDFHGGKPCQKKPITLGKCSMCLYTLEQAPGSPPPHLYRNLLTPKQRTSTTSAAATSRRSASPTTPSHANSTGESTPGIFQGAG